MYFNMYLIYLLYGNINIATYMIIVFLENLINKC